MLDGVTTVLFKSYLTLGFISFFHEWHGNVHGLFKVKAILILEHKTVYIFSKGICPKAIYTRIINKYPAFFRKGNFIDRTHETLVPFEVISSGGNILVLLFQELLEGPVEDLLCERVNDLSQSPFHLLNCLMTASELRE